MPVFADSCTYTFFSTGSGSNIVHAFNNLINSAMKFSNGKRILFANVPADGHFNPLTSLAAHLKAQGYELAWYSSHLYGEKIRQLGICHFPFRKAVDINAQNIDRLLPERKKCRGKIDQLNFDFKEFFIKRGPEYYQDLLELYQEFPFDLLVADCGFMGIPFVKEKMAIPVLTIGIVPLIETSKHLAPTGLGLPPAKSWLGRFGHLLLRRLILDGLFRNSFKLMHQLLEAHGIEHGKKYLFDLCIAKSDLYLQSGTPSFEYERPDLSEQIRFIGPVLPIKKQQRKEAWFDHRLLSYERVVLITQGTFEKDTTKLLEPAIQALSNSNCLLVVTTGGADKEDLVRRYIAPNVIIEDFIPFHEVLPYADLYISNGGYGGVLLSIQHAVPMVVAGIHEGKSEINARIGYFGLGINLKTERPKPEQIRKAVNKVLQEEGYRKRVRDLSREFVQYEPEALTTSYVRELLLKNTRHTVRFTQLHKPLTINH